MKKCTKCNLEKPLTEFSVDRQKKDGLRPQCKSCHKIQSTIYTERNREALNEKQKKYAAGKKAEKKKYDKIYSQKNKEALAKRKGEWAKKDRLANPEKYRAKSKAYKQKIRDVRPKIERRPQTIYTYFGSYEEKLPVTDKPTEEPGTGHLLVACKNCGKLIKPTQSQVSNRMSSLTGNSAGENNFYCSTKCKKECPLFNFSPERHYDPRLPRPENAARSCQTDHLKQIQCDEKGHNYCEKCGDIIDVELHHTLPVAKFKEEAINSAGHILLCYGCHNEEHQNC